MGLFDWLYTRLPSRKIEWEDTHKDDAPSLPARNIIKVRTQVRSMGTLAHVRNNWLGTKLILRFSRYIAGKYRNREQWKKQALQVCLHEMMHLALWDDKSITHSTDPTSLLYSMVDGSVVEPNEWDLKVMKDAAARIDAIQIDIAAIQSEEIFDIFLDAQMLWNRWLGRGFFQILPLV